MNRIAVLGWGSLIWSPRDLPHHGPWAPNGPTVPIEFSRIARDGRLTLIIDQTHGEMIHTWSSLAHSPDVDRVREDLAAREGCSLDRIGWTDLDGNGADITGGAITEWCQREGWDGVVWTQLPSTFEDRTGEPFSIDAGVSYLRGLTGVTLHRAMEYIAKAPPTTNTPLRRSWDAHAKQR